MNRTPVLACLAGLLLLAHPGCRCPFTRASRPLRIAVMDPLALQLACECVEGYAQRRYEKLATFLEKKLGRAVEIAFDEDLGRIVSASKTHPDLVVGRHGLVLFDAARIKLRVRAIARLTDQKGSANFCGLFVVRKSDRAKSIGDLKGRRIRFGPKEYEEKHGAALAALKAHGVQPPRKMLINTSCAEAALAVIERKADAAVISSYALALLEGCDTIDKGAVRVVGRTPLVPFVTVFATDLVDAETEKRIVAALCSVREHPALLKALETKNGFVPAAPAAELGHAWPDWRGLRRDAISTDVPAALPRRPRFLWTRPLDGGGAAGVAVRGRFVLVADKDRAEKNDIWLCVDADTGEQLWAFQYPAPGELAYGNSPRASPVIRDGRAYLLGAFGHLHCVDLRTGKAVWRKHLVKDFGGEMPQWGYSATPLIVGDKLIVSPGAKGASLVALNRATGDVIWRAPGGPTAYSSFILAELGGRRQIVGYDAISLGGWDPSTGQRLWEVIPKREGDFNVPTPIAHGGKLFVTTENNGSRLYTFRNDGTIRKEPAAAFGKLAPDTSTPVLVDGLILGHSGEKLYCLDARAGLRMVWSAKERGLGEYASFIGGNGRALILGITGELLLVRVRRGRYEAISRLQLFTPDDTEIWSHPALVGSRLYIRTQYAIHCLLLD